MSYKVLRINFKKEQPLSEQNFTMKSQSILYCVLIVFTIIGKSSQETTFRPGVVYQYRYESQILTGLELGTSQQSGLKLNCRCALQIQAAHLAILQLRDIRIFTINQPIEADSGHDIIEETHLQALEGDQADILVEQLSKPLIFRYMAGEIADVRTLRSDPYWSVNIKKGVASLLHLRLGPQHGEPESRIFHRTRYGSSPVLSSFGIRETDASGSCDTRYVVSTDDLRGSGSDGSAKIYVSKVKNFQSCSDSDVYTQGLFAGLGSIGSSDQEIIERVVHSDYRLRGDRDNFLIENAQLKAQYLLKLGKSQPATHIIQSLALMSTEPLLYPTRVDRSFSPDSLGLALRNPKASLSPVVDPLAGGEHYADIVDAKLTDLVELIKPIPDEQILRKLLELYHILRDIDSNQLFQIVVSYLNHPENSNNSHKSGILLRALPTLSSPSVAKIILRLIKDRHIDDVTAIPMLKTLSVIIHPTPDVVQDFMRYLDDLPHNSTLRRHVVLALGTLTNRLYYMMPKPPKTRIILVIESVSNKFQWLLRQASNDEERLLVIDGMSSLGLISLLSSLRQVVEDQQQTLKVKVEAVRALAKPALISENSVHPFLLGLYMDRDEKPEIRREAVRILLSSNPSESSLQLVAYSLHTESSGQLRTLVYSYIQNLANSETVTDDLNKVSRNAKSVLTVIRPVSMGWLDSQEYQATFTSADGHVNGRVKMEYSRSDDKRLPQGLRASVEVNVLGRNLKLLDLSLDVNNYEDIMQDIRQLGRLLNLPNILHSTRTIRSEGSVDLLRGIITMIQHKLSAENSAVEAYLKLNLLNHRIAQHSVSFNASNVEEIANDVTTSLMDLFARLSHGIDFSKSTSLALISNCIVLPTPFGTSLSVNVSAVFAASFRAQLKVENVPLFGENHQTPTSEKQGIKVNVTPSLTSLLLGHMGTDMRWLISGAGFKSTLSANIPINADFGLDTQLRRFSITHEVSNENISLVQWKHVPFTYTHYVPRTIDRLPYTPDVRPIMQPNYVAAESMYRWTLDFLGMHLLVNGSADRSMMISIRPQQHTPHQISLLGFLVQHSTGASAPIREGQNDGFWEEFSESVQRTHELPKQKLLIRIGTRRPDGSNPVTKCEVTVSQTQTGRLLFRLKASENVDDGSAGRMLSVDGSLSTSRQLTGLSPYIYQLTNYDQNLLKLNISWSDLEEDEHLNTSLSINCAENLSQRQIQNDIRMLKFNSASSHMVKNCALKITFSELSLSVREKILAWRDVIKHASYPNVRSNIEQSTEDKIIILRGYYDSTSLSAGAVMYTPGETNYILAHRAPQWMAPLLFRLQQDDRETVEAVTVQPPDPSYDCTYRCDTKRNYVCGTNGNTYLNFCHLRQSACRNRQVINVLHEGSCTANGIRRISPRSA